MSVTAVRKTEQKKGEFDCIDKSSLKKHQEKTYRFPHLHQHGRLAAARGTHKLQHLPRAQGGGEPEPRADGRGERGGASEVRRRRLVRGQNGNDLRGERWGERRRRRCFFSFCCSSCHRRRHRVDFLFPPFLRSNDAERKGRPFFKAGKKEFGKQ